MEEQCKFGRWDWAVIFCLLKISMVCLWFIKGKDNFCLMDGGNHRPGEPGRGLWRLPIPSPWLKAGVAGAGCSGPCPVRFWISPKIEIPWALWATSFCLTTLTVNIIFLRFEKNLLHFSLCPCLLSCHGAPLRLWNSVRLWEESGSIFLIPSHQVFAAIINVPPELPPLQAVQPKFSQPFLVCQMFQSPKGPFTGLAPGCPCLSYTSQTRTVHGTWDAAPPAPSRGEGSPLLTRWPC